MDGLFFANFAATAAIFSILLLRKFFINKIFSKVFVLLWMFVIIRLLLPFEFSSAISIYSPVKEPEQEVFEADDFILENILPDADHLSENETETFPENPNPEKAEISSDAILLFIWIFGAVSVGGFFAAKHIFTVKKLLAGSVMMKDVPAEFKTGNIRFYKSKALASPLSFGLLHPAIIIPENTAEKQLPFVLLHEHTHIKGRDAALKFLALCALSANWFNPAVWFMVKYFDRDIERYCDERVLKALGEEKASSYAGTILDFAERESLSLSYFSAASLCERVTSIMKNKNKKKNLPTMLCVFSAVMFVMTACGTMPRDPEEEISTDDLSAEIENIENFLQQAEEKTLASNIFIDKESGDVVSVVPYDNSLFYHFDGNKIKKIIIKDLGIPDDSPFEIICIKSRENSICANQYDKLVNAGLNIEQKNDSLIISVDKPLGYPNENFGIDIFADLENIEVVSEVQPINYFNIPSNVESLGKIDFSDIPYVADNTENSVYVSEETVENIGYMSFEEITSAGYYPLWMQPNSIIIYDAEGNPTVSEGAELKPEDLAGRNDIIAVGFTDFSAEMAIIPETKVEYDLHGFIQNIYFLWPDGSYNLSPPESAKKLDNEMEQIIVLSWPCEEKTISASMNAMTGHNGIDIGNKYGSDIYSSADGTVVKARLDKTGYGYHIIIDHGKGYQTLYAHCSEILVKEGDIVRSGDIIAKTGSSGNSTGPHLHFEIQYNETYLNPEFCLQP